MEKAQLVFIPFPAVGHLSSTVEFAKLLLNHHPKLSITFLINQIPPDHDPDLYSYNLTLFASSSQSNPIRFVSLPEHNRETFSFASFVEKQIPHVKEAVSKLTQYESESDSTPLVGFVLDMFCTEMIDVANDFGVPSYIFYTCGASSLGFHIRLIEILDEHKVSPAKLVESVGELSIPSLVNPFPTKAMPYAFFDDIWCPIMLRHLRRFKEAKSFIVNTFFELESYAIDSFSNGSFGKILAVYPVGPIFNVRYNRKSNKHQEIMQWLDDQPASSVVFLCFGSLGSFNVDQVKEIAYALELSGYRFLWSLRRPTTAKAVGPTSDYEDSQEVLPEGFLDRTAKIGKIIGWAPQEAILAHQAIGGFVSHCGWNSILESIWYGVPIVAWPLYAEQQFNAFEMVFELGLSAEIKVDYKVESGIIVSRDEIEKGISSVMELDSEKRKKLKKFSETSRMTLMEGGSSHNWLDCLVKDLMNNVK